MKASLYIETTIPSYLAARPSRNHLRAAHQSITKEWWEKRRDDFLLFYSQIVLDEVLAGDKEAALDRLAFLKDASMLEVAPKAQVLAHRLIGPKLLPPKAARDAVHLATAAVHGVHFLLTWNCRHLANEEILAEVRLVCRAYGCECPVVCTPLAIMGR